MRDRVLTIAGVTLRIVNGINWVLGIGMVVGLILTVLLQSWLSTHLHTKYPHGDVDATVSALRFVLVLGVAAAAAVREMFVRMLEIVATVSDGDPFVAANAGRLERIGWALLALQVLDLVLGAAVVMLDRLHVDHAPWTPTLMGWIATLMVFVLARVFKVGSAMRDDLATTV